MSHQLLLRVGGPVLLAAAVLLPPALARPAPGASRAGVTVPDARADGPAQPPYTREEVALGDAIFHGRAASGLCSVCHGRSARGTSAGPSLADSVWIHGDGSYESILRVVAEGVEHPSHFRIPMLAFGGAVLSAAQARAVAAYVHSLGGGARPSPAAAAGR